MLRGAYLLLAVILGIPLLGQTRTVQVSVSETVVVPPETGTVQILVTLQQFHLASEVARELNSLGLDVRPVVGNPVIFDPLGSETAAQILFFEIQDTLPRLGLFAGVLAAAQSNLAQKLGPISIDTMLTRVDAGEPSLERARQEVSARLEQAAHARADYLARVVGMRVGDALSRSQITGFQVSFAGDQIFKFDTSAFSVANSFVANPPSGPRYRFDLLVEYAME